MAKKFSPQENSNRSSMKFSCNVVLLPIGQQHYWIGPYTKSDLLTCKWNLIDGVVP